MDEWSELPLEGVVQMNVGDLLGICASQEAPVYIQTPNNPWRRESLVFLKYEGGKILVRAPK